MSNHLTLSAYEDATWRILRLVKIVSVADQLLEILIHLHDHKGILTATWLQEPSEEQKKSLGCLWEIVGNEPAENVEHKVELVNIVRFSSYFQR